MPIKGLTSREAAFPRIGKIRKGAPKPENGNRPGQDLEWFRLDTDDEHAAAVWKQHFGDKPQEINVFLPFETPDECFSTWMEDWVAGGLVHRCDGENVVIQRTKDGEYERYGLGTGPACPGGCKEVGRLAVIIPELERLATLTVETHSKHDIMNLSAQLNGFYAMRGSLLGIPFVLRRVKEKISTPGTNGKRVRREKWLLQIEPAPVWVAQQMIVMRQRAMPQLAAASTERFRALPVGQALDELNGDLFGDGPGSPEGAWDMETFEAGEDDEPETVADAETGEIVEAEVVEDDAPPADIELLEIGEFYGMLREEIPFYAKMRPTVIASLIQEKTGSTNPFGDLTKASIFATLQKHAAESA